MVDIILPDGARRSYDGSVTAAQIAADIGPGLAKAALAARLDGQAIDLTTVITVDATLELITAKDHLALEILRHDAAHALAEAVRELYPDVKLAIGPPIQDGFYYDFACAHSFTPDDLTKIEQRMHRIVERNEIIHREVWSRKQAEDFFKKQGEIYKSELLADIPADETITVYKQGDFIDLCRGPHFTSTGQLGSHFKLTKVAGAYWRGDHRNPMLQRIYGTAWFNAKDLKDYLHRIEEAEKRDHRRLGREMGLFHFQEEAPGGVFWHDKGWTLYREVEDYIRRRLRREGYSEVHTPLLVDRSLWEKSGHWDKFRDHMFTAQSEERILALKPMNCPGHVQIFKQGTKSYRDLPLRMAEFGCCHRNEPSGALHGLMRARAFTQDDAHIFCSEDQIAQETTLFCSLLKSVYADFGFTDIAVKFSDRPVLRVGADSVWDRAETALQEAANQAGLKTDSNPGEGAFYGPKLEFILRDAIGREWQCGTLQVDFFLPERLDATFIGEDGAKHHPVMLHRAVLGSLERFTGILVEHYAGRFPLWLAPLQVMVATITDESHAYAEYVAGKMNAAGLRCMADLRNEKITYKIREHSQRKIPLILVVGRREAENKTVALRRLGGKDQEILSLDAMVNTLKDEALAPDMVAN